MKSDRKELLLVALIYAISLFLPLYPNVKFWMWGGDTGEYYYLLNQLVHEGGIDFSGYPGWGRTYPYFPGMIALCAIVQFLFPISVLSALKFTIPVVSSLSVVLVYLICKEIFKDSRVALFSALFLAVLSAHVYPTSHPMPGAMGGFLLILCIYLLLLTYRNSSYGIFLVFSTLALIFTHHLSTLFLMLVVIFIPFIRELHTTKNSKKLRIEIPYIIFLCSST